MYDAGSYKTSFMWSPRRRGGEQATVSISSVPISMTGNGPTPTPMRPSKSSASRSTDRGSVQSRQSNYSRLPTNRRKFYVPKLVHPPTPRLMDAAGMSTNSPRSTNAVNSESPAWWQIPGLPVTKPSPRLPKTLNKNVALATGCAGEAPRWMTDTKHINVRPAKKLHGNSIKRAVDTRDIGPMSDDRRSMHYYPESDIAEAYCPKRNPYKARYEEHMKDRCKQHLMTKGYTKEMLSRPDLDTLFRDEIHAMEFASAFGRDTLTPTRRFGFRNPRPLVKDGKVRQFGMKRHEGHLKCSPRGADATIQHYGQGHGVVGGRSDADHGKPVSLWQMKGSPVKNTLLCKDGFDQIAHGRKFIDHGSGGLKLG
jgi:hypothetical protein